MAGLRAGQGVQSKLNAAWSAATIVEQARAEVQVWVRTKKGRPNRA